MKCRTRSVVIRGGVRACGGRTARPFRMDGMTGSRQWLTDLGFSDWCRVAYVFGGTGWAEYSQRPALLERDENTRGGLYAVVAVDGINYDDLPAVRRFNSMQQRPDGSPLPDVPNKSKPGGWRRRSRTHGELTQRWVAGVQILYLGQTTRQTLKARIQQLRSFALGIPDRWHTGGELLWQLSDYPQNLELAVLPLSRFPDRLGGQTPLDAEKMLFREFRSYHGDRLPFANGRN